VKPEEKRKLVEELVDLTVRNPVQDPTGVISGLDETAIINAIDPDGIFVELVGAIRPRPLRPAAAVCASAGCQSLVGSPLRVEGGTGSPMNLLALF
jgi:hypothetical protein